MARRLADSPTRLRRPTMALRPAQSRRRIEFERPAVCKRQLNSDRKVESERRPANTLVGAKGWRATTTGDCSRRRRSRSFSNVTRSCKPANRPDRRLSSRFQVIRRLFPSAGRFGSRQRGFASGSASATGTELLSRAGSSVRARQPLSPVCANESAKRSLSRQLAGIRRLSRPLAGRHPGRPFARSAAG